MNYKKTFSLLIAICLTISSCAFACSNFVIKAKDGSVVNGRSMEFPIETNSDIWIIPAGTNYSNTDENGNPGLSWATKHGFLGINAYKIEDAFVEGFNEKGLSIGGLMYTGSKYQTAVPGKFVNFDKFVAWVLGNFETVDEVKKALPDIYVSDSPIKQLKGMGLHMTITDVTGKGLVVEFIDGQAKVYDNPLGILTNRPDFEWQMTNLRNYINLDAHDKDTKKMGEVKIEPTGVGSGLLGLPGDWTPPSRFIRLAICKDAALEPKNAEEAVNLSEHLLNIVDIPKGAIKESPAPLVKMYGYAQWVIIKDLTNKVLYFKTYDNTAWKSVDLKKFDLKAGAARKSISIDAVQSGIADVSEQLK